MLPPSIFQSAKASPFRTSRMNKGSLSITLRATSFAVIAFTVNLKTSCLFSCAVPLCHAFDSVFHTSESFVRQLFCSEITAVACAADDDYFFFSVEFSCTVFQFAKRNRNCAFDVAECVFRRFTH